MGDRLEELRHELDELRRDLEHEPRERLPDRIGALIVAAVEALEALEAESVVQIPCPKATPARVAPFC